MCGIVGYVGKQPCVGILVEGLRKLEYRGYDSAGVAVVDGGTISVRKSEGKIDRLAKRIVEEPVEGSCGIGHTRWATHGGPTDANAHPHLDNAGRVAVVHNGIIENHEEQRTRLRALGYVFESQTDTEVVAHLIHHYFRESRSLFEATRKAAADLRGAYAIGVVALADPETITGARMGCPLVIGVGDGENFLASDVSALIAQTRRVIYLEDGDVVALSRAGVRVVDARGAAVERTVHLSDPSPLSARRVYEMIADMMLFARPPQPNSERFDAVLLRLPAIGPTAL